MSPIHLESETLKIKFRQFDCKVEVWGSSRPQRLLSLNVNKHWEFFSRNMIRYYTEVDLIDQFASAM